MIYTYIGVVDMEWYPSSIGWCWGSIMRLMSVLDHRGKRTRVQSYSQSSSMFSDTPPTGWFFKIIFLCGSAAETEEWQTVHENDRIFNSRRIHAKKN